MRYLLALLSLVMLGASLFVGYAGFVFAGLACDESCYGDAGWSTNPDAWQWDAAQVASGGLVVAAFLFVGAMIARARPLAVALLLAQGAATTVLMSFAVTGTTLVSGSVLLVSAIAFAPVIVGAAAVKTLRAETRSPRAASSEV
jgi:uncharacterized membrane protein YjgN (DUF898 family)